MGFIKFIFSKKFLLQLVIAAGVLVVLAFGYLFWLDYYTGHDEEVAVPDLRRLSLSEADKVLSEHDLRRELIDSAAYNPDYPPQSVIEQTPQAGMKVKENRKIYLKLNPSDYRKVEVPALVDRTKRQAIPTLKALGFEIGDITYKPSIAKDLVLEMRHDGKKLTAGTRLPRTAKIDLVLGDDEMQP